MLRVSYTSIKKPFKKKKQQTKACILLNSYSGLPLIDLIFPATYEVELEVSFLFIGEELRLRGCELPKVSQPGSSRDRTQTQNFWTPEDPGVHIASLKPYCSWKN